MKKAGPRDFAVFAELTTHGGLMFLQNAARLSMMAMLIAGGLFAAERHAGFVKASAATGRQVVATPTRDQIFPYLSDGNGWTTNWVFTNLDSKTIVVHLEFSNDDGSALSLNVSGVGFASAVDVTIGANGAYSLLSAGTGNTRVTGYAFAAAKNGTDLFAAYSVIRNVAANLPDLEFTVPLVPLDENNFTLAFDNTGGYSTFVALINSATKDSSNTLVSVQDKDGNVLATDQISVPVFGRLQFNLTDRYPQLAGIVGNVSFTSAGQQYVSAIGLRSGPNQSLTAILPFSLPR